MGKKETIKNKLVLELKDVENTKQIEFLSDIRKVGMNIIFGTVSGEEFYSTFVPYAEFIEQDERYVNALNNIKRKVEMGECSPDDLLITLGKFTLEIEYDDEVEGYGDERNFYDTYY